MQLSEAIRLGAMMRPQAYGSSGRSGSCAIRAAAEALGMESGVGDSIPYNNLRVRFPMLDRLADCPECREWRGSLMYAVYHLNDTHRWPREQIADWLVQFEPKEPAPQPVVEIRQDSAIMNL